MSEKSETTNNGDKPDVQDSQPSDAPQDRPSVVEPTDTQQAGQDHRPDVVESSVIMPLSRRPAIPPTTFKQD